MEKVFYMKEGKVFEVNGNSIGEIIFNSIESYTRVLDDLEERRSWKKEDINDSPLNILGMANQSREILIDNLKYIGDNKIIYTGNFEGSSGLYFKNIEDNTEELITKLKNIRVYDFDYSEASNKIVCSYSINNNYENNLLLIDVIKSEYSILTEGKTINSSPVFDTNNPNIIYYDCAGLGFDKNGKFIELSNRYISKLSMDKQTIDDILYDVNFDYYKPFMNDEGELYYIKRPKQRETKKKFSFKDILLVPFKIIKALFNWLDFFTRRYSGEALNTTDENPAKTKERSEMEIFIEGNLLDVEKELIKNKKIESKTAGIIPASWKLMKMNLKTKEETLVQTGVLDYIINKDGEVIYSNGKYIMKKTKDNLKQVILKEDFAINLGSDL